MRCSIEELNLAGLQGILGAHHLEAILLDQLLQYLGPVPQVISGGANVGPDRLPHECLRISSQLGVEQSRDGRPHPVYNRPEVHRLIFRRPPKLGERRFHGTALGVTQHDDEASAKAGGGKLDAADLGRCDDVAGHPDDKEVAQALVKHQFRRHSRIGASEDNGEGFLALVQLRPPSRGQV